MPRARVAVKVRSNAGGGDGASHAAPPLRRSRPATRRARARPARTRGHQAPQVQVHALSRPEALGRDRRAASRRTRPAPTAAASTPSRAATRSSSSCATRWARRASSRATASTTPRSSSRARRPPPAIWALEDVVIETRAQITIRGAAFYSDEYVKQGGALADPLDRLRAHLRGDRVAQGPAEPAPHGERLGAGREDRVVSGDEAAARSSRTSTRPRSRDRAPGSRSAGSRARCDS